MLHPAMRKVDLRQVMGNVVVPFCRQGRSLIFGMSECLASGRNDAVRQRLMQRRDESSTCTIYTVYYSRCALHMCTGKWMNDPVWQPHSDSSIVVRGNAIVSGARQVRRLRCIPTIQRAVVRPMAAMILKIASIAARGTWVTRQKLSVSNVVHSPQSVKVCAHTCTYNRRVASRH